MHFCKPHLPNNRQRHADPISSVCQYGSSRATQPMLQTMDQWGLFAFWYVLGMSKSDKHTDSSCRTCVSVLMIGWVYFLIPETSGGEFSSLKSGRADIEWLSSSSQCLSKTWINSSVDLGTESASIARSPVTRALGTTTSFLVVKLRKRILRVNSTTSRLFMRCHMKTADRFASSKSD